MLDLAGFRPRLFIVLIVGTSSREGVVLAIF